ncbi:hypothetical protein JTB14_023083 [Gonioctena quinquepunctata]|nr:hypothetical protein JTB14_023083 [Gonioctena quinquepunctata]
MLWRDQLPVAKNIDKMDNNRVREECYLPLGQSSGETKGIDFSNKVGNYREMVSGNRSRDQTYSLSKDGTYDINYCSGNQPLNSSRRISEILGEKNWQTLSETPREFSQNNTTITLESEQRIPVNQYSKKHHERSSLVLGPIVESRSWGGAVDGLKARQSILNLDRTTRFRD